jgi:hypothetical protein
MVIWLLFIQESQAVNGAHEKLITLSNTEQKKLFSEFMRSSGERCEVIKIFFQGKTKTEDAIWNLRCRNGKDWSVTIKSDSKGSTNILQCSVLKHITNTDCFKKF